MDILYCIVARFQVPFLHDGHTYLIKNVLERCDEKSNFCIVLGNPFDNVLDNKNILSFDERKSMLIDYIQSHFPSKKEKLIQIASINDMKDNQKWSQQLDIIVRHICGLSSIKCVLVGSRDSFLQVYSGKYDGIIIPPVKSICGTDIRHIITNSSNYLEELCKINPIDINILRRITCIRNFMLSNGFIGIKQTKFLNGDITNIPLMTDSYKLGHWKMYEQFNVTNVYSYFEARKGAKYNNLVFVGLQYLLKKLEGCVVTSDDVLEAQRVVDGHLGQNIFNKKMWDYIVETHNGRLPIRIRAVEEGTIVPVGNVLFTIENLDSACASLTNHLETFLMHIWFSCNVATISREIKLLIKNSMLRTSDSFDGLDFKLHDFGYRGTSSNESAGIGSLGHLAVFRGTDTVAGLQIANKYYHEPMAGYSVSATEHSIQTVFGKDGEYDVIEQLISLYPEGILSMVLDSYNIYSAVEYIGSTLKEKVLARNGKLVVRPDSGYPPKVTIKILNILDESFGSTVNSKGFKVLNPKVGLIYGDGLDYDMISLILLEMEKELWSTDNIVFGMGGGLLQNHTRDTERFAAKCSAIKFANDDNWKDVFKNPITSTGLDTKTSKAGRLKLIKVNNMFVTVREDDVIYSDETIYPNLLKLVYENGTLFTDVTLDKIRKNIDE